MAFRLAPRFQPTVWFRFRGRWSRTVGSALLVAAAAALTWSILPASAEDSSAEEPAPEETTVEAPVTVSAPAPQAITVEPSLTILGPETARETVEAASPPAPAPDLPVPPSDLRDPQQWVQYRARGHLAALPQEARLFYRRGLGAWRSGEHDEAVRLVRAAGDLDPSFIAPHLTLASWSLLREPSQALLHWSIALDLLRRNFMFQVELVGNLIFFLLSALFFGVLAAAALSVVVHQRELRHLWEERLMPNLSARSARWWAFAFLLLPLCLGLGLALPTLLFLGMLWPLLHGRERFLWVMLMLLVATAPLGASLMGRLASPLRDDAAPLYGVPGLESASSSPALRQMASRLAHEHPENGFVQFGLGWTARRGGDPVTAAAAYRRALAIWPSNERVLNNLGNLEAIDGNFDAALELYQRATRAAPRDAAAWFNASQVHTRLFNYKAAGNAVARASALDFELVKTYGESGADGSLPLVDQWIAPASFWRALLETRADLPPAVPAAWRGCLEARGWTFSGFGVALGLIGLMVGLWWQRKLALRSCANCGHPVCRRCAARRRELALCPKCVVVESRAQSPEFARALLGQHRLATERRARALRAAVATLIPGYGLLALRRVFGPLFLIMMTTLLVLPWVGAGPPFAIEPRSGIGTPSAITILGLWGAVYALSIGGYLLRERQAAAHAAAATSSRGRSVPVPHLPEAA